MELFIKVFQSKCTFDKFADKLTCDCISWLDRFFCRSLSQQIFSRERIFIWTRGKMTKFTAQRESCWHSFKVQVKYLEFKVAKYN